MKLKKRVKDYENDYMNAVENLTKTISNFSKQVVDKTSRHNEKHKTTKLSRNNDVLDLFLCLEDSNKFVISA